MLITRDGLLRALAGWHADLTRFRAQLDRINTLPVPDHDTGTHMLATVPALLAETAAAAHGLRQRADSGSVGLYFLLRRLLGTGPQAADEVLFEPLPDDTQAACRVDHELAEFMFTVHGAGRAELLSLLHRLGMDS